MDEMFYNNGSLNRNRNTFQASIRMSHAYLGWAGFTYIHMKKMCVKQYYDGTYLGITYK